MSAIQQVLFSTKPASGGPPALIISGKASSVNTNDVTVTINATGANFIVVNVGYYNGGAMSVSDATNGAYSALTGHPGGSESGCRLFYHQGGTYGSSLAITASQSGTYCSIQALAFSNMASSPFDQQNGAAGGSVASFQTGSITPSQANTVVIVGLGTQELGSGGNPAIDGGYTIQQFSPFSTGVNEGGAIAYQIFTSASAQNPTWSVTGGNAGFADSSGAIASFKY